jgi:ATP-binding cassette subfamily B (MDR/TAP) protein 1
MFMLGAGMGQAANGATDSAKATAAANRVFELIDRPSKIDFTSNSGASPDTIKGRITFEDVHFSYPSRPDNPVAQGYNLTIEPGTTVALVGASGSGKSTAIQLLERFYDPDQGTIRLDGADLRSLNLSWLRSQIGLVAQEPVLFTGTIAENIAYGKPGASRSEIEAAAKMANAHQFISEFPDGYDTSVGGGGGQLSGGQKQRVAIARAIIKNPSVLLLDEATSALDTESERVVQAALDDLLSKVKRTTIVIAHRLSTIRNSDKICVVEQGRIVEEGTHDQLMAKKGFYFKLNTEDATKEDESGPVKTKRTKGKKNVRKTPGDHVIDVVEDDTPNKSPAELEVEKKAAKAAQKEQKKIGEGEVSKEYSSSVGSERAG